MDVGTPTEVPLAGFRRGNVAALARSHGLVPGILVWALVVGAGFASGGYFPGSWGWLVLGCSWAAALALLSRRDVALTRLGLAYAGSLAAFAAWVAASGAWTSDPTQTSLQGERTLVYVAAVLAALITGGRSHRGLVRGLWAAVAVLTTYSLLTRLLPDHLGVYDPLAGNRLSEPVGYWNSLGLLAAMGILLAVGISARSDRALGRSLAAASIVPMSATLYFTFSRGAWIALAIGTLAMLAIDQRRLHLLGVLAVLVPWPAAVIAYASRSRPLTSTRTTLASMAHDGHHVLLLALVLAVAAGLVGLALATLDERISPGPRGQRGFAGTLLALAVVGLAIGAVRHDSLTRFVQRSWHQFATSAPAAASGSDLNARLFHLSGSGRVTQWRVAWHEARADPVLGSGAGTYERYWDLERPTGSKVRNVHNLYLETLAELGPIGLGLLCLVLLLPLVALPRARLAPFAAAAAGAYVAFLAHAAVDWDWQITSVTLVPLLCGVSLIAAGRGMDSRLPPVGRAVAIVVVTLLAAGGVYTIAERVALAHVTSNAQKGNWPAAERAASRAARLAPWSTEPWQRLGEAELAGRRFAEARTSFRRALAKDGGDWSLWFDLARASTGGVRAAALDRAGALNPHSPEVASFRKLLKSLSALGSAR